MPLALGDELPNRQALRRSRYQMSHASSSQAASPTASPMKSPLATHFSIGSPQGDEDFSHGSGAKVAGGNDTDGFEDIYSNDSHKLATFRNAKTSVEPRIKFLMRGSHKLSNQMEEKINAVDFALECDRVNELVDNNSRALEKEIKRVRDTSDIQRL